MVTSNTLTFTVNIATAINPISANNYGIKYYPNPVNTEFIIDSLALSDKWQSIDLFNVAGSKIIFSKNIIGQSRVLLSMAVFPKGQYVAVLNRRSGASVYLKFIKL
jgi:hypothetical protein